MFGSFQTMKSLIPHCFTVSATSPAQAQNAVGSWLVAAGAGVPA